MTPAESALSAIGVEATPTNLEHMAVLLEAFDIFLERNGRYRDEWRRTGWRGMLFESRKKLSRVWQVFWNGRAAKEEPYDDLFDCINYLVFFLRMHREGGAPWGEWEVQ